MTARTWTPYTRAPINTRVLLQFSDGYQTIGRYDSTSHLWLDDSHENIVATNPDRTLLYYRGFPPAKAPQLTLTLSADEGEAANNFAVQPRPVTVEFAELDEFLRQL